MKKINVINGLRGFAIVMVVSLHLFRVFTPAGFFPVEALGFTFYPFAFLPNGWVGVNLFFILSGFVLYLPYAEGKREMGSLGDALFFYKRRAVRLLPLYYLSIIFLGVFFWNTRDPEYLGRLYIMATMTFNFTYDYWMPRFNPVLWSIGIEVMFSMLFPFILLLDRRVGTKRLFILTAVLSLAVRFIGAYHWDHFRINSTLMNPVKDSVIARLDDFVLGMLICRVYLKGEKAGGGMVRFAAGLIFVLAGCNLWEYYATGALDAVYVPVFTNFFHLGFYLMIMALLSSNRGVLRRVFTNHPIQLIGMMCYSIYLWHFMLILLVFRNNVGHNYTPARMALYFLSLFGLSAFTYKFFEFRHKGLRELFLPARA